MDGKRRKKPGYEKKKFFFFNFNKISYGYSTDVLFSDHVYYHYMRLY